jgi:hypothetical protein
MLKKIGLSAAVVFAVVALAQPPAAMAADRDDFRGRDNRYYTAPVVHYDVDRDFRVVPERRVVVERVQHRVPERREIRERFDRR